MSTAELRRAIKKNIDHIPVERLSSVADYIEYMTRKPLIESVRKAEKDIREGRGVPWRKVRRDV